MKHQSSLLYRKGRLVLLFLLLANFHIMQAICKPIDAYTTEVPTEDSSVKIYLSEGTSFTIAEGTIISATEFVHTDVKKTKIKLHKKAVKKIKAIKKEIRNIEPATSLTYTKTFSPCKPNPILDSNGSFIKQVSINSNSSFKSFAVTQYTAFISIILSFSMILILFHQDYPVKISLLGNNFQRPPPIRRY